MKAVIKQLLKSMGYQISRLPPAPASTPLSDHHPTGLPEVPEVAPVAAAEAVTITPEPAPEPTPQPVLPERKFRRSLGDAMEHLSRVSKNLGFAPQTILDIGAADGTPELYTPFPGADFFLVEPLQEYESSLQTICNQIKASYEIAAVGDHNGSIVINITPDLYGSSVMNPAEPSLELKQREIPLLTLDSLVEQRGLKGPFILKSDSQGSELRILKGAEKTIAQSEAIVLEVQFFQFVKDGDLFFEVVAFLKEKGFVVYDIIGHNYRFLDNALAEVDLVFVKENGRFRQSHFFGSPEQRAAQFVTPDQRY
jgi:FkbM family methyltransferase